MNTVGWLFIMSGLYIIRQVFKGQVFDAEGKFILLDNAEKTVTGLITGDKKLLADALGGNGLARPITEVPLDQVVADGTTVGAPAPGGVISRPGSGPGVSGGGRAGAKKVAQKMGASPVSYHNDPQGQPSWDAMCSGRTNTEIAEYFRQNREAYGVKYIISQMRICSARENWRWRRYSPITSSGDFTHNGHVHITFDAP